jgi:hypothetical protein
MEGKWLDTAPADMRGNPFTVGDKVARAYTSGRAVNLQISEVTRIVLDKIYLDDSKVSINYPGRLLIVSPLFAFKEDI